VEVAAVMIRRVSLKLAKKKKKCSFLKNEKIKIKQCAKNFVNAICAKSCGRCCDNVNQFKFTLKDGTTKDCEWLSKKASRIMSLCKDAGVSVGCANVCRSCMNYTGK